MLKGATIYFLLSVWWITFFKHLHLCIIMECIELNWLFKHMKKIRSRLASIPYAELSKTLVKNSEYRFGDRISCWSYTYETFKFTWSCIIFNSTEVCKEDSWISVHTLLCCTLCPWWLNTNNLLTNFTVALVNQEFLWWVNFLWKYLYLVGHQLDDQRGYLNETEWEISLKGHVKFIRKSRKRKPNCWWVYVGKLCLISQGIAW